MARARRRLPTWVVAASLILARSSAGWSSIDTTLQNARFRPSQTYYLYVPEAYSALKPDRWPLLIAVHGRMASGRGEFQLWKQYADREGFVLVAPNFIGKFNEFEGGSDRTLVKIVEEVSQDYRIDRDRVLLSGFSWGAEFAYRFAMSYPSLVSAAALLNPGTLPAPERAQPGRRPRFYIAVGGNEPSAAKAAGWAAALRQAGYQVELVVASGVGHSIPSRAIVDVLRLLREMKEARI